MKKEEVRIVRIALAIVVVLVLLVAYSLWTSSDHHKNQTATQENRKDSLPRNAVPEEAEFLQEKSKKKTLPTDTTSQNILFIGDSMAEGLKFPLQQYAQYNKHKFTTIAKTSASIVSWVGKESDGKLRQTIKEHKPSFVLISLGSNDLFTKYLEEYEKYLDNIVKQLDSTKFVWVCPPNWKDDFGLTELIEQKVGSDRFFPSKVMKIPRAGDKIHPTVEGYNRWADSLAYWIMHESRDKIRLQKKPEEPKENKEKEKKAPANKSKK
jgi:lysophospholipase L1-like esterase